MFGPDGVDQGICGLVERRPPTSDVRPAWPFDCPASLFLLSQFLKSLWHLFFLICGSIFIYLCVFSKNVDILIYF